MYASDLGVDAIIIGTKDSKEADKVVYFLGEDNILRTGIAKSASRSFRRFINSLQPFSFVRIYYTKKSSFVLLRESNLKESFQFVREDPLLVGFGYLVCEVIQKLIRENDIHEGLFTITLNALYQLNSKNTNPLLILAIFIFKIMTIAGYSPSFEICDLCKRRLDKRWVWQLNPQRCVCAVHHLTGTMKWEWDEEILSFLRTLRIAKPDEIWHLGVSDKKLKSLFRNLCLWIEKVTEEELKSYRWLEKMESSKGKSGRVDWFYSLK